MNEIIINSFELHSKTLYTDHLPHKVGMKLMKVQKDENGFSFFKTAVKPLSLVKDNNHLLKLL